MTKQQREVVKAQVLACAKSLTVEFGPAAVKLLPIAQAFGTSTLSVKRWCREAGADLSHLKRGRPHNDVRVDMIPVYELDALRARAGVA